MNQSSKHRQRGAALAIGLIFLLVATIVTVAGMRGSNLQERMTSNLNHKAMSLLIAEVGASDLVTILRSEVFWDGDVGSLLGLEDNELVSELSDRGHEAESLESADGRQSALLSELIQELNNEVARDEDGLRAFVESVEWNASSGQLFAIVLGESLIGGDVAGQSRIRLTISEEFSERINRAFEQGLLSNQSISIKGQLNMIGSAHTNANFTATSGNNTLEDKGDSISTISAVGSVDVDGLSQEDAEKRLLSNQEVIDVPSALEFIACYVGRDDLSKAFPVWVSDTGIVDFEEYCDEEVAENALNYKFDADDVVQMTGNNNCSVDPDYSDSTGRGSNTIVDLRGKSHFCEGDFDGGNQRYKNGVILVTGDIRVRGGAGAGDDEEVLSTGFYAGGDITLRGSAVLSGLFWGDGKVVQSGTSLVRGTVISGGSYEVEDMPDDDGMEFRGGLQYEQVSDFGDLAGDPITVRSGRVAGWTEVVFDD